MNGITSRSAGGCACISPSFNAAATSTLANESESTGITFPLLLHTGAAVVLA